jgi:phosphoglycerate dehydrogenase-like enzyme
MTPSKRVLIPNSLFSARAEDMLLGAGHEVIFALPAEERKHGAFAIDRAVIRHQHVRAAFDAELGRIHAIQAQGPSGHLPVTSELMDRAPNREVIFIAASGTDKIDVAAATERGILVVSAPGGNARVVAEHTLALLLSIARRLPETDRWLRAEKWPVVKQRLADEGSRPVSLEGKTLAIVGLGAIGRTVAGFARAFGMIVLAYDPFVRQDNTAVDGVPVVDSLAAAISQADFVSLHAPLTESTRCLLGRAQFAQMKPGAYLVNTSRGELVDTEALVDALASGAVRAAGLDVTDPEPLPPDHPLMRMDTVVVTPHVGGLAQGIVERLAETAVSQAIEALAGRLPDAPLNPEAWEAPSSRQRRANLIEQR